MSDPEATPRAEKSLNRQTVLEEDEYLEALSKIIARDFFPSLVHLDATNDYLDAVSSKDPKLIQKSVRKLQQLSDTPLVSASRRGQFETPRTPWGETPAGSSSSGRPSKRPKYETNISLDEFQARYTSEDNSSFTQILDEENKQRKEVYGWAYDAQKRVEAQNRKALEGRERMMIELPSGPGVKQKFRIEAPVPVGLLTDGSQVESEKAKGKKRAVDADEEQETESVNGNALAVVEKDAEVNVLARRKDTRSAGVDGWKFKARNALMFAPDANVSPYHPPMVHKVPEKNPKVILHNSTRLPEQDETSDAPRSLSAPSSPTRSRIDAAITGTPYRPRGKDEGFTLVPNLPSPKADELGPAALKQLMTWGTLNATPRVISQSDDAAAITADTPFHLPKASRRETIGLQLSNKASKSLRAKAEMLGLRTPGVTRTPVTAGFSGKRGDMAPPTWTPRKSEAAGNLTPAAKRLLQRTTMSAAGLRRADVMEQTASWDGGKERELSRVRWTPTPLDGRR
ncbi:nuclear protein DGCR14 [Coprinopsis sp. MPI-PUGE-AT-0042]|nr:nuclear protein DGCR14 [Coprinopsis sp. MPI-PUGE-AT-0042]